MTLLDADTGDDDPLVSSLTGIVTAAIRKSVPTIVCVSGARGDPSPIGILLHVAFSADDRISKVLIQMPDGLNTHLIEVGAQDRVDLIQGSLADKFFEVKLLETRRFMQKSTTRIMEERHGSPRTDFFEMLNAVALAAQGVDDDDSTTH